MLPTLKPGDEVLVDARAYRSAMPHVGDVVVAAHPYRPNFWLIKRISQVQSDGRCYLVGDNRAESTDSRAYGWFEQTDLLGKVTSYM